MLSKGSIFIFWGVGIMWNNYLKEDLMVLVDENDVFDVILISV